MPAANQLGAEIGAAYGLLMAGNLEGARSAFDALAARYDPAPGVLLEGLANACMASAETTAAYRAYERAYAAFIQEDDLVRALRMVVALVNVTSSLGEEAAARGWEQRGLRLADAIGPCVERGYLALARTGCNVHDPGDLAERAEQALSIAREFGDRDLELRSLGDRGLALVSRGSVVAGFQLLDEVMVAIVAGEMRNPGVMGPTICAMLAACERTGDVSRAEYWSARIEQLPFLRFPTTLAHCALVQGAIECLRGRWELAEQRLTAWREVDNPFRLETTAKLAEMLLQLDRAEEASELLAGHEDQFACQQALAQARLAQGDFVAAAALLRAYERGLGDDCLRRAVCLGLLIEAELGRSEIEGARWASERLIALDERCESNEIRALARLGAGRIARQVGDLASARAEIETALTLLLHYDRPLLASEVRLELARTLVELGQTGAALIEVEAALATFRRLGIAASVAAAEALRAACRIRVTPAPAEMRQSPLANAQHLTARELEIAQLVATGLTNREIADSLVLSVRTVETHVDRVLGKLDLHTRTQLANRLRSDSPLPRQDT